MSFDKNLLGFITAFMVSENYVPISTQVLLTDMLTTLDCRIDYLYGELEKDPRTILQPHRRKVLTNKWQKIMAQAGELLEQNPGFTLFVSGHSLGGALATIFAFEAAASVDPIIPKPVLCVTVAAPKSGNLAFRLAMEVSMARGAGLNAIF
jgi:hypothetical protein